MIQKKSTRVVKNKNKEMKNLLNTEEKNINQIFEEFICYHSEQEESLKTMICESIYNLQSLSDITQMIVNFEEGYLESFSVGDYKHAYKYGETVISEKIMIKNNTYPVGQILFFFKNNPDETIASWTKLITQKIALAAENELMQKSLILNQKNNIDYFLSLIKDKDKGTFEHCKYVAMLTNYLCNLVTLSPEDITLTTQTAMLHDIGKIKINDEILNKPDKLSAEEFNKMKMHSQYGYEMLCSNKNFKKHAEIILQHHERYDGTGYPKGLKGKEICLPARILAIADTFDAMIRIRPYKKKASDLSDIISELRKHAGKQFDPDISIKFADIIENRDFMICPSPNNNVWDK